MAVLSLAAAQRCPVHVRQTSTALTALVIGELRRRIPDLLTAEVTPHHLVLTLEDFIRWGTEGLIMPPLRTATDVDARYGRRSNAEISQPSGAITLRITRARRTRVARICARHCLASPGWKHFCPLFSPKSDGAV